MKTIIQAPLLFCDGAPVVAHLAIRNYPQINYPNMDIGALARIESHESRIKDPTEIYTLYLSVQISDPQYVVPITVEKVSLVQKGHPSPVQLIVLKEIAFYTKENPYHNLIGDKKPHINHAFNFLEQLVFQFSAEPHVWIQANSRDESELPGDSNGSFLSALIFRLEQNPVMCAFNHLAA